jgi:hypothetical protein
MGIAGQDWGHWLTIEEHFDHLLGTSHTGGLYDGVPAGRQHEQNSQTLLVMLSKPQINERRGDHLQGTLCQAQLELFICGISQEVEAMQKLELVFDDVEIVEFLNDRDDNVGNP